MLVPVPVGPLPSHPFCAVVADKYFLDHVDWGWRFGNNVSVVILILWLWSVLRYVLVLISLEFSHPLPFQMNILAWPPMEPLGNSQAELYC